MKKMCKFMLQNPPSNLKISVDPGKIPKPNKATEISKINKHRAYVYSRLQSTGDRHLARFGDPLFGNLITHFFSKKVYESCLKVKNKSIKSQKYLGVKLLGFELNITSFFLQGKVIHNVKKRVLRTINIQLLILINFF